MEMKTSFQLLFKIKFIADFIWKYKLLLFDKGDVADVGAGSRFKAWVVGTGLTACNFSLKHFESSICLKGLFNVGTGP